MNSSHVLGTYFWVCFPVIFPERSPIGPTLGEFDWIEMVLSRLENKDD